MRLFLVRVLVGTPPAYPTGAGRIRTVWDALRWRLADLPFLDAAVGDDGRVQLFRRA